MRSVKGIRKKRQETKTNAKISERHYIKEREENPGKEKYSDA
jgi:hypothetical protein